MIKNAFEAIRNFATGNRPDVPPHTNANLGIFDILIAIDPTTGLSTGKRYLVATVHPVEDVVPEGSIGVWELTHDGQVSIRRVFPKNSITPEKFKVLNGFD